MEMKQMHSGENSVHFVALPYDLVPVQDTQKDLLCHTEVCVQHCEAVYQIILGNESQYLKNSAF